MLFHVHYHIDLDNINSHKQIKLNYNYHNKVFFILVKTIYNLNFLCEELTIKKDNFDCTYKKSYT